MHFVELIQFNLQHLVHVVCQHSVYLYPTELLTTVSIHEMHLKDGEQPVGIWLISDHMLMKRFTQC